MADEAHTAIAAIRPEDFALPSERLTETLRTVTKQLFDHGVRRRLLTSPYAADERP
jgi:hypothetical protein